MNFKQMKGNKPQFIIAFILIALSFIIIYSTYHMVAISNYDKIGPTAFPYIVALGLLLLGIATFIEAIRHQAKEINKEENKNISAIIWILAGLTLQILLITKCGFSIASGIMFAFTSRAFKKISLLITILIGVSFSLFIWLFFTKVLKLGLPTGLLENLIG